MSQVAVAVQRLPEHPKTELQLVQLAPVEGLMGHLVGVLRGY
jgi:hypothetical protein